MSKPHRWVMLVTYELSEENARVAARAPGSGPGRVDLDHENRLGVEGPGCLDCEEPFDQVAGMPCLAPAYDYEHASERPE